MVSHPSKRTRAPVNEPTLPLTDQQILQRAAALLNKSVADLLQSTEKDSSKFYATPTSQSYSTPNFYGRGPITPYAEDTATWLSESQFQQQDQTPSRQYVEQFEQIEAANPPPSDHSGLDLWQGIQLNSTPIHSNSFLPPADFSHLAPQPHMNTISEHNRSHETESFGDAQAAGILATTNHGYNHHQEHAGAVISDSSSESSEIDTEGLDSQPWENVQITAVQQLVSSENDPDSDYLWLDDVEEISRHSSGLRSTGMLLKENRGGNSMLQSSYILWINHSLV